MAIYYRLDNIDMIAKQEGNETWLFDRERGGWVPDRDHLLPSRLLGGQGGTGVCERISEEDAQQAIGRVEDGVSL